MNWNDLQMRVRAVLSRDHEERALDEELAFHIEMEVRKNRVAGMSETEARRKALLQFGRTGAVKKAATSAGSVSLKPCFRTFAMQRGVFGARRYSL